MNPCRLAHFAAFSAGWRHKQSCRVEAVAHAAAQRRYNTLSLLDYYMGPGRLHKDDISWNPSDPNVLRMTLPGMGAPPCHLPGSLAGPVR